MAWRCTGKSNAELVDNLVRSKLVSHPRVVSALKETDRAVYCPYRSYVDAPQSIGYSVTISAPHMHAVALQKLEPALQPGSSALDVGCGSGYLVGAMARLVGPSGKVVGIDNIKPLVDISKNNVTSDASTDTTLSQMLAEEKIRFEVADGRQGGPSNETYDAIHVGAAAAQLVEPLLNQLNSPGLLFIPIGELSQNVYLYEKDSEGKVSETCLFGVSYVPLTDPPVGVS